MNVTFTYAFTCSHPTNTSIEYQTNTELEAPRKWLKSFTATEMLDIFQLANTVNSSKQTASTTLFLSITQIDELVKTIDEQIGASTSKYNLTVKPEIHIVAETDVGIINEIFSPNLEIGFKEGTPELNYISIGNLEHTGSGTITGTQQVFLQWVVYQRAFSYVVTVVTISFLAITAWFYIKTNLGKPSKKPIEKIVAPYKEIIAETTQKPLETTQTITMATLEDLVKIAENLVKPILHKKGPKTTHTFFILDNNIKYEYVTKET